MKYTISILTYSAVEHSKRCLKSVLESVDLAETRLILTANGNHQALSFFRELEAKHPANITVVWNETNLGFIEPNKHAFSLCDTECFVLLNDDTVVSKGWLEALAAPFSDPKAAISGLDGGCSQLLPNFHGTMGRKEYIEFSCAMLRTSVFKEHGLFSPKLVGAYAEDSTTSLRMRELGYKLHWVKFKIGHARCATSTHVPQARIWQDMNHTYARKRWGHYLNVRKMDYPIIVRRTGAWGDVLLTTPLIKAIHKERPLSPIIVETACQAIFRGNPAVSKAINMRVDSHDALTLDLNMAYEQAVNTSILDAYKAVAERAGFDGPFERTTELYVTPEELEKWKPYEGRIALHVGPTAWDSKNWPMDRWQALIDALPEQPVLVGHPSVDKLEGVDDLRGKTTVHDLAALLNKCKLLVTVDSFPLHVAQAVGTPVVGLFGVTKPELVCSDGSKLIGVHGECFTYGLRHRRPGTTHVTDNGVAMNLITPEMVFNAVNSICHSLV